ncbi:calcitonin gene-related peptide-like isoform X3 [Pimephales promelas]|uniref:calcitonin gene-related peptide-like isoform X3 n=1 Tax=Pimephales promelas TaxID=90988 RepID=UPI00195572ED|nr:calcitonin gene-related peptide-like isoform X3 [Pimephales promelas]XP_039526199.1 calcitonin gene-related peptide-like isoform X3 [Pimephales promelas]
MFLLKISALLVVLQMSSSSAAPARPASESLTDRFALMDYEARRLLSAIVKNVVQMTAEELEPTSDDDRYELHSVTAQKRACNTATCVTHRLAHSLSRSGGMGRSGFIRTDVGPDAFGRRRRRRS